MTQGSKEDRHPGADTKQAVGFTGVELEGEIRVRDTNFGVISI